MTDDAKGRATAIMDAHRREAEQPRTPRPVGGARLQPQPMTLEDLQAVQVSAELREALKSPVSPRKLFRREGESEGSTGFAEALTMRLGAAPPDPPPLVRTGRRGRPPRPRTDLGNVNRELAGMLAAEWRKEGAPTARIGKRTGSVRKRIIETVEALKADGQPVTREAIERAFARRTPSLGRPDPRYVGRVLAQLRRGISTE